MKNKKIFCKYCGSEIIFLKTKKSYRVPVNPETVRLNDSVFDAKVHMSHFATCTKTNKLKKNGRLVKY